MIPFNSNPLLLFVVLAIFVAGLVVYPFINTERFRITPQILIAVFIAVGIAIYSGSFAFLFGLLWPLSFICFPEYWGSHTGFLRGPFINQKSPAILVSSMGWFFLVVFPLLVFWIIGR